MIDRRSLRQWGLAGLLAVAGLVAYSNAIGGAFVFDDLRSIVDRADALNGPLGPLLAGDRRPLVTLTLAANHRLGGLDPRGYHAFNVAVHIATALALFTLVRHATTRVGRPADATALAFAGGGAPPAAGGAGAPPRPRWPSPPRCSGSCTRWVPHRSRT